MTVQALSRYILMLAMALIMAGIIVKVKALWGGRYGAPLLQPVFDIIRLFKKSQVVSEAASDVFKAGPSIALASVLAAALPVPISSGAALISFKGDFVFFVCALAAGRFFTLISALDTGGSFSGMGAGRMITLSALIEPAFFIIIATLAQLTGKSSFSEIYAVIPTPVTDTVQSGFFWSFVELAQIWSDSYLLIPAICGNIVLLMFILAEAGRVPVSDPATLNEPAMITGALTLEVSGPDLAFMTLASFLRISILGTLITGIIVPAWVSPVTSLILYMFIMFAIAATIGLLESVFARFRLTHVPQFLFGATGIALIVLAVLTIGVNK
ncbi:MAG: NADH-quinone oxidoreductase subunit H [Nitrospirae bacterium YQR-1]